MEMYCYVCNKKGTNWPQNLAEIKSKHSGTPVIVFIEKFRAGFPSQRNINDKLNPLCSECLSQIYSYDWMCIKVKEQETRLRHLLQKTEIEFNNIQIKTEEENFVVVNDNGTMNDDAMDVKPKLKPSPPTPPLPPSEPITANDVGENVKKRKPIIVRVVKRVPFLKSKSIIKTPAAPTVSASAQPNKSISTTTTTTVTSNIGEGKPVFNRKPIQIPNSTLTKKTKLIQIKVQVCKFCDAKFKQQSTLEVTMLFKHS